MLLKAGRYLEQWIEAGSLGILDGFRTYAIVACFRSSSSRRRQISARPLEPRARILSLAIKFIGCESQWRLEEEM
jgi:hypothetical protein